ncbi:MAG: hypothetical protein LBS05_03885 [Tannerellaceae bacterium]|jgi:hypothetical protein|nr:hypothetical protein [Tannerellaceae bacterium]
MVQIEELGKVIAQIVGQRDTEAANMNPVLVQGAYQALKIDTNYLLNTAVPDIILRLDAGDGGGLQRMEIAARLMIEEACFSPDLHTALRLKAKEMLQHIQANDTTFSIERNALLDELEQ